MEHRPAAADVAERKRVPESVDGSFRRLKPEHAAMIDYSPVNVPMLHFAASICSEEKRIGLQFEVPDKTKNGPPQFQAEGDKPLTPSLAVQHDNAVVEVHINDKQLEKFPDACAGVEQHEDNEMEPPFKESLSTGTVGNQLVNLLIVERGHDLSRFDDSRDTWMFAAGAAFPIRVVEPVQVCVARSDDDVAASRG